MNRRNVFATAAILLSLVLTGCGNKGPLVLPDQATDTAVPAQSSEPGTEPASATEADLPEPPPAEPASTEPAPADNAGTPAA